MKKKVFIAITIILVIGLVVLITSSVLRKNKNNSSAFTTATVTRRDIGSTVLATGIIKPMVGAEVKVGSRI